MKNKKLTKSEINLKLLNKYKVSIDDLNYDALKIILKIFPMVDKKAKLNIKFGTLWLLLSLPS